MRRHFKALMLLAFGVVIGVLVAPQSVQAAINYFDVTKTVSGYGTASCGSGWRVTGGGAYQLPSDFYGTSSSSEYAVTGSWPYSSSSWRATGTKVQGTYFSSTGWRFTKFSYSPRVYAICTQ